MTKSLKSYAFVAFVVLCAASKLNKQLVSSLDQEIDELVALRSSVSLDSGFLAQLYGRYVVAYDKVPSVERLAIFADSVKRIVEHNNSGKSWLLGLTQFSDMTEEEFRAAYLISEPQDCSATSTITHRLYLNVPESYDWRDRGVVSQVKNQGRCGSCWTFSTTGAIEAHWKIKKGESVLLSEQQLVDCAQDFDNHGCNGGLPSHAFEYIRHVGGIESEEDYPYKAVDGRCNFDESKVRATVLFGSANITALDEEELVEHLFNAGPISIAFTVTSDFRNYKSGVWAPENCPNKPTEVNHAVLAVGYGIDKDSGLPYYTIKNSWSENWGDHGYFKMKRGVNMCGVAQCASYPDLERRLDGKPCVSQA